jgi:predicted Holliday junction resolvase-like endonuclease
MCGWNYCRRNDRDAAQGSLGREAVNEALLTLLLLAACVLLYKYLALKSAIETRAQERYEAWREKELQAIRKQYQDVTQKEAVLQFQQWKQESEGVIRKDAIEKSRAVILGKVTEHVVPFFPGFQHNPKDARFIGTPVDFVVFDGLDDGEVRGITFVEVKTGSSSLSTRERQVRNVIKRRSVEWEELRIPPDLSQDRTPQGEVLPEVGPGKTCLHCREGNREQARFCGHCGRPLLL